MNGNTGGGRGPRGRARLRRRALLPAALAGIALLVVACGGGSASTAGSSPYAKALAYSQCMRAHGVAGFPDPQSNGAILVTPKDHLAQGSPQFVAANKACEHLDPPTKLSPARQQQLVAQALKFSECMRAHGIPNFPDPSVSANGISVRAPAGSGGPNSPVFKAAQQACRKFLPGLP